MLGAFPSGVMSPTRSNWKHDHVAGLEENVPLLQREDSRASSSSCSSSCTTIIHHEVETDDVHSALDSSTEQHYQEDDEDTEGKLSCDRVHQVRRTVTSLLILSLFICGCARLLPSPALHLAPRPAIDLVSEVHLQPMVALPAPLQPLQPLQPSDTSVFLDALGESSRRSRSDVHRFRRKMADSRLVEDSSEHDIDSLERDTDGAGSYPDSSDSYKHDTDSAGGHTDSWESYSYVDGVLTASRSAEDLR